jgi:hypothetical protein
MALTQVEEVLKKEGLGYPRLSVLQANESLYTALLVQPQPRIYVSATEIRNLNSDDAESLSKGAMNFAKAQAVELLVLPEYSVPWRAVETVLQEDGGPAEGQVWVLGCESISVGDVLKLKQRFSQYVTVLHEPVDPAHVVPTTAAYFDPLIYLFRTRVLKDGTEKLVMLVQFKTHPSGDPANTEVTSMAKGRCIYLFQGPYAEVRLTTFICSDVLAPSDTDINECYDNTLLLHIQLNDNPRATVYSGYKRWLFRSRCDRTELICLNWAAGIEFHFKVNTPPITKTNIAGSAWHTRSDQVDTSDAWVEENHKAGLYYTRNEREKCHVLHFSYESAAFLIHATKVRHTNVPAAQSYRRGPKLSEVLTWNPGLAKWQNRANPLDDGFHLYCNGYDAVGSQLLSAYAMSPLTAERIVELTGGAFSPGVKWYKPDKLKTARINTDEIVQRITVTQDPESNDARNESLSRVEALAKLTGHIPFTRPLEDLNAGFKFTWSDQYPYCNVVSVGTKSAPATVIYAGVGKRPDELASLYTKISIFARQGTKPDRFGVVYQEGIHVKLYLPEVLNPINKTVSLGNDITEPEK